ncbi:uncharacterized protein LOC124539107 [Vanessa cardui]|uniref:uncharacterized protein LOC124539107 n=1 Tax=Vanessa cardui TaxID=171605 RepID=UPI001F132402|nr:uncharacterized protein LOC124539107 [Vanessa cardui]
MESWICLLLFVGLPKTVMFTYKAMKAALSKDYVTLNPTYIYFYNGLNTVVLICLPAILFELISNEVDNIRSILISNSLVCSDEVLLLEIQRTLDYMRFRPMKYSICRMFPLNASLPLKFVSLCVTYIIVCAQFTSLV